MVSLVVSVKERHLGRIFTRSESKDMKVSSKTEDWRPKILNWLKPVLWGPWYPSDSPGSKTSYIPGFSTKYTKVLESVDSTRGPVFWPIRGLLPGGLSVYVNRTAEQVVLSPTWREFNSSSSGISSRGCAGLRSTEISVVFHVRCKYR